MKILIVSDFWQPLNYTNYRGGAESYTMSLWKSFISSGENAWLLTTNDVEFEHHRLHTWPDPSKETFTKTNPNNRYIPGANFESVLPWIEENKFDVIITSCTSVKLVRLIAKAGVPIIHVSHTIVWYRNDPERFKALNEIKKSMKYRAITVSKYAMDDINDTEPGYIDEFLHPTYMEYEKVEKEFNYIPRTLIYAGRVAKTKDIDILLDCYKGSEYEVLVVGDAQHHSGSEYEWYLNTFKPATEQYPNIKHITNISQRELFNMVRKSAGLIVPCPTESFSLSGFEAQKLGVPVIHIMSKVGALQEFVVDGKTGVVIDTFRLRKEKKRKYVLERTKEIDSLNREEIYNHFQENYSEQKFINDMIKQINILLGGNGA